MVTQLKLLNSNPDSRWSLAKHDVQEGNGPVRLRNLAPRRLNDQLHYDWYNGFGGSVCRLQGLGVGSKVQGSGFRLVCECCHDAVSLMFLLPCS